MISKALSLHLLGAILPVLTACAAATRTELRNEPQLPIQPILFLDKFQGSEGITFSAEGKLFAGANNGVWIVDADGSARRIADVHRHLGQWRVGARDILAADFGPRNAFEHGPNTDGIIWRVTPEGTKTVFASGIGDPNGLVRLPGGTWLVSDDATDRIYSLRDGRADVWSTEVPFPNGMTLSRDGRTLYVAQTFNALGPVVFANQIWSIPLRGDRPAGPAKVVAQTERGPDGLVSDRLGRIYVADNMSGSLRRFDPKTGDMTVIATGMPGIASLVFGEGRFDSHSIYATTTARGGGKIWRIPVGVRGARLH